eukprot:469179-Pleurochrysis_carterae.AAC.1
MSAQLLFGSLAILTTLGSLGFVFSPEEGDGMARRKPSSWRPQSSEASTSRPDASAPESRDAVFAGLRNMEELAKAPLSDIAEYMPEAKRAMLRAHKYAYEHRDSGVKAELDRVLRTMRDHLAKENEYADAVGADVTKLAHVVDTLKDAFETMRKQPSYDPPTVPGNVAHADVVRTAGEAEAGAKAAVEESARAAGAAGGAKAEVEDPARAAGAAGGDKAV